MTISVWKRGIAATTIISLAASTAFANGKYTIVDAITKGQSVSLASTSRSDSAANFDGYAGDIESGRSVPVTVIIDNLAELNKHIRSDGPYIDVETASGKMDYRLIYKWSANGIDRSVYSGHLDNDDFRTTLYYSTDPEPISTGAVLVAGSTFAFCAAVHVVNMTKCAKPVITMTVGLKGISCKSSC